MAWVVYASDSRTSGAYADLATARRRAQEEANRTRKSAIVYPTSRTGKAKGKTHHVRPNPSIRTGKFKGATTYYSGGPKITLAGHFRSKHQADRGRGIRYMVGFNEGSSRDYINAKKLSTAKAKGEAYAKHRGWTSFWVQNQATASILNFKVVPTSRGRKTNPGGPLDTHAARELELFVENDADLHRQQGAPINKNLITKMARGVYNHAGAVKLFGYLMESGAKKYIKQHGSVEPYTGRDEWHQVFSPATRKAAAERFADHFEVEAKLGNYDHLLPKKYSDWRLKKNPGRLQDVMVRSGGRTFKAKAKYDPKLGRVRVFANPRVARSAGYSGYSTQIDTSRDFHTLSSSEVEQVLAEADRQKYRKPKNASGSRARYFYAKLQREAERGRR